MATPVRELITRFVFQVDRGSATRADAAGESAKRAGERAARGWVDFTARIGLAINGLREIGRIGSRAFKTIISGFIETADASAKNARALGENADELQRLGFAVQIHGGSQKGLEVGLKTLTKRMRDATLGLKTQKEAFAEVGIGIDQLRGKKASEVFRLIADGMSGIQDPARRAALAQELLGRQGITLVNTLAAGGAEIDRLGKRFDKLGGTIGAEGRARAEKAADAFLMLKVALQGVRNRIAIALLPRLTEMAEKFAAWASDGDRVAKVLEAIKLGARVLGSILATMAAKQIAGLVAAMGQWVVGLFAVDAANKKAALSTRLLGGALGLLKATGILLVAAALQDLFKLATGGQSEIAKALGPESAKEMKAALTEIGGVLKDVLKQAAPLLADLLKAVKPLIPMFAKIAKVLVTIVGGALKGFITGIQLIRGGVDVIRRAWDTVSNAVGVVADKLSIMQPIADAIALPFKAIGKVIQAAKDALNWLQDKWDQLRGFFGVKFRGKAAAFTVPTTGPAASAAATAGPGQGATAPAPAPNVTNTTVNISGAGLNSPELAARIQQESEAARRAAEAAKLRQAAAAIGR